MIVKKYYKLVRVSHEDEGYLYIKNTSNEAGIFKMRRYSSSANPDLQYSLDGTTWTTYSFASSQFPEIEVAAGSNIYLRGTNPNGFNRNEYSYVMFSFNKTCEAHGNLCSLLDSDPTVFSTITSIPSYAFHHLFNGVTTLTTAPDFGTATTLNDHVFMSTFSGCTALTTAPDFSSVTSIGVDCLEECFYSCTSLTDTPDLSGITSIPGWGLYRCFNGTAITTAPDFSSVTSIGERGLENCFSGCSGLITPPNMSGVTSIGSNGMNNCFSNCSNLTSGPDLSSVTSVGSSAVQYCFYNSPKVGTVTAPNISDLTTNSVLFDWLNNAGTYAAGTKTVRVPTGATITTNSVSGIPTGWTRVDY